jgi:type IV pilus modification protein PilV
MMPTRWRSRRGLTLIEVTVALLVIAVGALAVARLIPQSVAVTANARRQTLALHAAEQKMEQIVAAPYADVVPESLAPVTTDSSSEYRLVQRQVAVSYVDPRTGWSVAAGDLGMKRVRVTAQWLEGRYTRRIALETLVADR